MLSLGDILRRGWWVAGVEREQPEGAGEEKGQAEGKVGDAFQNLRGGACARLFIFSLFIDRTSRAVRRARGHAGPPTGGEEASLPPAPPRC